MHPGAASTSSTVPTAASTTRFPFVPGRLHGPNGPAFSKRHDAVRPRAEPLLPGDRGTRRQGQPGVPAQRARRWVRTCPSLPAAVLSVLRPRRLRVWQQHRAEVRGRHALRMARSSAKLHQVCGRARGDANHGVGGRDANVHVPHHAQRPVPELRRSFASSASAATAIYMLLVSSVPASERLLLPDAGQHHAGLLPARSTSRPAPTKRSDCWTLLKHLPLCVRL